MEEFDVEQFASKLVTLSTFLSEILVIVPVDDTINDNCQRRDFRN